jgi:tetratricopeptide (TPR) repeat protein
MPIPVALRRLARLACLTALAAGCYWSVRLAWADHLFRRDTESAVARAVELAPGNAEYHARLALLRQEAGRDETAIEPELRAAVQANPRMSSAWIELGLRAEIAGEMQQAEADLERSAQVDHTYATLWTLANFYFRRNDRDHFWPVARQALSIGDMAAYDPAPLFRLCWKLSRSPATVLDRAIPAVGAVQARYLAFLVREDLAQIAEPVTQRIVALGGERDLDAVLDYCDRLIEAGDAEHAIHAWNALCWRMLHNYRPLAPLTSPGLTNGVFASAPVHHGFDWRMPDLPGVDVERGGLPPRLRITLDGRQPDTCELLAQVLAVVPSRRYRLRFHYQSDGLAIASVRWRLADVAGREIPSDSTDLASEVEATGTLRFRSPRAASLLRLALTYRRPPGAAKAEGRVTLNAVWLEFEP